MSTKSSFITDAQKRAIDEIERLIFARTDAAYNEQTKWANANYERLKPIVGRTHDAFTAAVNNYAEKMSPEDEWDAAEISDEVLDQTVYRVSCNPPADEAVLAVAAKPYISQADYDALTEGWVKFFGPVPS